MVKTNILKILLFLLVTLSFYKCTKLLFENPVPNEGDIIEVLPDYFSGTFLKKGEQIIYDIERLNEKHIVVYGTDWIHKDSITAFVEGIKNDSTYAEFREGTLIIKDKDSTQRMELRLVNDLYYSEKEPVYELNLEEGYFIDDFDSKQKKKAILKYYKQKHFLNIIDDKDKWLVIWVDNKTDSLIIRNSFIADTLFTENLSFYNRLTKIEKIEDKTFIANPSDEELFNLIEEPSLFTEEVWIRVENNEEWNFIWIIVGFSLVLLFIIFLITKKSYSNRRLH